MENISKILENMKFKKKLFGGVDELDVWENIEALEKEFEKEFLLQEERYKAIIDHLNNQEGKDE